MPSACITILQGSRKTPYEIIIHQDISRLYACNLYVFIVKINICLNQKSISHVVMCNTCAPHPTHTLILGIEKKPASHNLVYDIIDTFKHWLV
jgi:hypothetical protein